MERVIAYCGLVCSECSAYLATKAGDREAVEKVAAQWREEYHAPNITAENVWCDGCLAEGGRHCGHCAECGIRACGVARKVENCGRCPDYAACEKIKGFLEMAPEAKAVLDEIAAGRE